MKSIVNFIFLLIATLLLSSCSLTRSIEENQKIVAKNSIKIHDNKEIPKVELESYIKQPQTPKALAFFYTNLYIYKKFSQKKDNWFNRWIMKVFGDEPIIWHPSDTEQSVKDIKAYLGNIGYFNAKVYTTIEQKDKKVNITYHANTGPAQLISRLDFEVIDSSLRKIDVSKNSLIKKKDIFNVYTLDDERDQISELLRNHGFYDFNKEYVIIEADTSSGKNSVGVSIIINPQKAKTEESAEISFLQYNIKDVFIYTDYENDQKKAGPYDTLIVDLAANKRARAFGKYQFLYKNRLKINPNIIAQSIFIEPDENFNSRDLKETYKKLNRFPNYKYVDINFVPVNDTGQAALNTYIKLYRSKLQYFSLETDGTNSSGDLGIRFSFNYGNKNIFRGGELIKLRLTTAFENRKYSGYENNTRFLFFNTLEYGVSLSLYSPSFIVPLKQSRFPKYFKPQTYIQFGYNYQLRPSYERYISNFQFGYEWKQNDHLFHRLTPLDLSVTKIFPSDEFQASLDSINNQRYKDQYQDHFIAAIKYDLIFNTQQFAEHRSFQFFNLRLEAAGNLTYGLNELFNASKTDGYYTMFGIRFAQYFRAEADYRQYIALPNKQGFVYRLNAGLGLPYGNSLALPFEKGFYSGGANGMRAWAYRDLGPGSYTNTLGPDYDKMGDIKLEGNIEYRFPLYGYLKGAAFVDAGNIWLLFPSETFEGGMFNWNSFYEEIAFDAGIGFRLDFDFFIFRVDGAAKVKDPSKPKGSRFVIGKTQISDVFWSFGIGYPF